MRKHNKTIKRRKGGVGKLRRLLDSFYKRDPTQRVSRQNVQKYDRLQNGDNGELESFSRPMFPIFEKKTKQMFNKTNKKMRNAIPGIKKSQNSAHTRKRAKQQKKGLMYRPIAPQPPLQNVPIQQLIPATQPTDHVTMPVNASELSQREYEEQPKRHFMSRRSQEHFTDPVEYQYNAQIRSRDLFHYLFTTTEHMDTLEESHKPYKKWYENWRYEGNPKEIVIFVSRNVDSWTTTMRLLINVFKQKDLIPEQIRLSICPFLDGNHTLPSLEDSISSFKENMETRTDLKIILDFRPLLSTHESIQDEDGNTISNSIIPAEEQSEDIVHYFGTLFQDKKIYAVTDKKRTILESFVEWFESFIQLDHSDNISYQLYCNKPDLCIPVVLDRKVLETGITESMIPHNTNYPTVIPFCHPYLVLGIRNWYAFSVDVVHESQTFQLHQNMIHALVQLTEHSMDKTLFTRGDKDTVYTLYGITPSSLNDNEVLKFEFLQWIKTHMQNNLVTPTFDQCKQFFHDQQHEPSHYTIQQLKKVWNHYKGVFHLDHENVIMGNTRKQMKHTRKKLGNAVSRTLKNLSRLRGMKHRSENKTSLLADQPTPESPTSVLV